MDKLCRPYLADGRHVLTKMFGSGIGYPQRRSDGMCLGNYQSEWFYQYPKVDSFDLYKGYVAETLLKHLLAPDQKREQVARANASIENAFNQN